MRSAAGAGAAGLAVTALAGAPALAATRQASRPGRSAGPALAAGPDDAAEPLVVHVRDVRTGELDIYRGTSHTRLHDSELASMLARASR